MSINRFDIGNTLYNKVILPSLAHASGVWFPSSKKAFSTLNSIQYSMAKAILSIRCMPSMTAVIGEMGWLPINDYMDTLRISYYTHLQHMEPSRLTKKIAEPIATNKRTLH